MKKIKSLLFPLAVVMLMFSCDDDGGDSIIDLQTGGVPNIEKVGTLDSFINLNEIQSGNDISIGVTVGIGQGDVVSMNVVGFYIKGETVERAILASNVTTFPATITLSQQDLIDKFTVLNTADDFELGDQLKISSEVTLADGTVLNLLTAEGASNYGQDIANSGLYSVVQTYNVSCPSDLGGTYAYTTTNVSAPTGETAAGPLTGTTTITDEGGGVYALEDASFGGWLGLYGPGNIAEGVKLKDICNKIAYSGVDQFDEVFTFSNLVVNGSELSFHWENDYGEFGDTTLTRTDGTDWPPLTL